MKVRYSPRATADIIAIADYLTERNRPAERGPRIHDESQHGKSCRFGWLHNFMDCRAFARRRVDGIASTAGASARRKVKPGNDH